MDLPLWCGMQTWCYCCSVPCGDYFSPKLALKLKSNTFGDLKSMGHIVEKVGAYEEIMGHAGALVCYPNGLKEGGYDLRSDGLAIGG